MNGFAQPISELHLLDAIVRDPDCLEAGLRLLETDRVPDERASVASGFDRTGRPVVLYVTGDVIEVADVEAALAYGAPGVGTTGRVLVVAAGFRDEWHCDPPTLPGGWELEPLRWQVQNEPLDGETVIEISEAGEDGEGDPPDAGIELRPPRLTGEEIESLLGSWAADTSGSRR